MAIPVSKKILILCKTYPSPSSKHVETSCVAGMDEQGKLVRLFPVPYRLMDDEQKFEKWQWITAKFRKANSDNRPESHNIFVDTIDLGDRVDTKKDWTQRRLLLEKLQLYTDFSEILLANERQQVSLALLKPVRVDKLEIVPVKEAEWSEKEKANLLQAEKQADLFLQQDAGADEMRMLRKLPFDFYYHYTCKNDSGESCWRHKLVDWEVGALFWNCQREYGEGWEKAFRGKIEEWMATRDLLFLMGNMHRFQDQWLIISIFYPPKLQPGAFLQESLF